MVLKQAKALSSVSRAALRGYRLDRSAVTGVVPNNTCAGAD